MPSTPSKFRDHDSPDPRLAKILIGYFDDAAGRIRQAIITPPGKSASTQAWNQARASAIGAQVHRIQGDLQSAAAKWVGNSLSKSFRQGTITANQQAKDAGVRRIPQLTGSFHVVDRRAAEILARDTYADLAKAAGSMGKVATDTLRRMAATGVTNAEVNKILAGGVIEGKPVQAIRELREQLKKVHGDTVTITDKNGDPMTFKAGYYAKMVAVTKTREAVCKARHARLADLGLDLVTIVGKVSNNFCTAYLDKVFSISGQHPKYPALSSLPGGGPPFHPNCSKSTAPFVEDFATDAETVAAEPPQNDPMTSTKDTTTLQKLFQMTQGRQEAERRHDDVVQSIRGQGAAVKPWDVAKIQRSTGKTGLEISRSLNAIGSVHDLPPATPSIPIRSQVLGGGILGRYRYTTAGQGVDIEINPNGDHRQSTMAHEFGHFIDHQVFGTSGSFGSTRSMTDLMDSIRKSAAVTDIERLRSHSRPRSELRKHATYLLDPAELFARAYAQYIADKSGKPVMRDEIKSISARSTTQWSDRDFAPIRSQFDTLFKSRGL